MGFIKGLIDNVPSWLGGDALRGMVSGMEGAMSGDVLGKINNFVDGTSDEGEGGPVQNSVRGKGGGFNMLNPMSWFSGDAQKATTGDLDNVSNDTLAGKLYNRRKQQEEMMRKLRGQGGPTGPTGPTSSSEFIKLPGMGGATGSRPSISLTSKRGMREHPVTGKWQMHQGTDISAKSGTPMFLPLGATIVDNRPEGRGAGYGNSIYFTTTDGITHLYAHMKKQSKLKIGQTYAAGTKVGEVGSTGVSTGPHLHWETGTTEGDVGRSGRSLFEPLSKYNKYAPFTKDGPGTPSLDGSSSSSSSSYSADGSTPGREASAAALSVSPITSALRGMASTASSMSSNIANRSDALQKSGMESGLADSIAGALAPLASIPQLLMSAANSNAGGGTMSPQDPGMQGSGDVSMFPTTSPVRDGGHVFQGDI
jgi:murein DD-endopeptidase MepM/ murein hydrolase activator NlpD